MSEYPDIVVVGGGIVGLSTAWALSSQGVRAHLIEKDDIGFEQSGRSTAAVIIGGVDSPTLPALAGRMWNELEQELDTEIEINREGWLSVAVDESDVNWWENDIESWRAWSGGAPSIHLSADEARKRFPTLAGEFVALEIRPGGHVNPRLVLRGLERAAREVESSIEIGTVATGFEISGGRITAVVTGKGRIPCDGVVIAAGVWAPRLCDELGLRVPLQRVRVPIGETGPIADEIIPGFLRCGAFGARQNRDGTIRVTGGFRDAGVHHDLSLEDFRDLRVWLPELWKHRKDMSISVDPTLLRRDFLSLLGSLRSKPGGVPPHAAYEPRPDRTSSRRKLAHLTRLVPSLKGVRIHRWSAGVVDLSPDLEPVIGRIPGVENAYAAFGFSGHGFILGPAAGRALAQLIISGETEVDLEPYRPERFAAGDYKARDQLF